MDLIAVFARGFSIIVSMDTFLFVFRFLESVCSLICVCVAKL